VIVVRSVLFQRIYDQTLQSMHYYKLYRHIINNLRLYLTLKSDVDIIFIHYNNNMFIQPFKSLPRLGILQCITVTSDKPQSARIVQRDKIDFHAE